MEETATGEGRLCASRRGPGVSQLLPNLFIGPHVFVGNVWIPFLCFRYENKYVKFFKSKPGLPPGLSASDSEPQKQQQHKIPGCADGAAGSLSKSAKRNLKRKEKRKQHDPEESAADVASLSDAVENVNISAGGEQLHKVAAADDSPEAEKAKKIKNMRKKLRQVEELQHKLDSGEIKQPTQDQLEKLARAKTLREDLEQLEGHS